MFGSIYLGTSFIDRVRRGRDPALRLYDDTFTELPGKSEFSIYKRKNAPAVCGRIFVLRVLQHEEGTAAGGNFCGAADGYTLQSRQGVVFAQDQLLAV